MHQTELKKYRALLMGKRGEILRQSRQPEDIWIVPSNETIETVQLAGEREFAVRALEREAKSLSQIGAALARIDDGEFGICMDCEEPISPRRLAAVPWAAYCLRCQEQHDIHDRDGDAGPQLAA